MNVLPPKPAQPIPLHVIGGLQGSGKTTYIQRQIQERWCHEKLGVILCEEGAVKLDFTRTVPPRVERLLNACVCCEMAYAFFQILIEMLQDAAIERIVVEISAQADIQQIFDIIRGSHLKDYFQFEPVHILIDARNPHLRPESPSPMIRRLLHQADVFVISFHDAPEARNFASGGKPQELFGGLNHSVPDPCPVD